jgi:hypothetical protein
VLESSHYFWRFVAETHQDKVTLVAKPLRPGGMSWEGGLFRAEVCCGWSLVKWLATVWLLRMHDFVFYFSKFLDALY